MTNTEMIKMEIENTKYDLINGYIIENGVITDIDTTWVLNKVNDLLELLPNNSLLLDVKKAINNPLIKDEPTTLLGDALNVLLNK